VDEFLKPSETIECDHPRIVSLAEEVTEGARDEYEKARRLFLWVRDKVKYALDNPFWLPEHYRTTGILDRGQGYCVQKAMVLCSLARAGGIPARLIFADIINHMVPQEYLELAATNLFVYHCYTDMYLGGKWIQATPAFDQGLCEKMGYPLVEFDGHHTAIFPPTAEDGRKFVDYVRDHGPFADIPLEPMLKSWEDTYGRDKIELWKSAYLKLISSR
jgi:transglutaminase-like putative cysteine protease